MQSSKSRSPSTRGPLAKTAMSHSSAINYELFDLKGKKCISRMQGALALEEFKHPDFNGRAFTVFEVEAVSRHELTCRSWVVNVHLRRDGVFVTKSFSFNCRLTLEQIKELNQLRRAAKKPVAAKKSIKARTDML